MRRLAIFGALVVALAAGTLFFKASQDKGVTGVALDLCERAAMAKRADEASFVLIGTPAAEPFIGKGFGGEGEHRGKETFEWVRQGATLKVPLSSASDRDIILDIEAYAGIKNQALTVLVQGQALGTEAVPEARTRIRFFWPRTLQGATNDIELRFKESIVPAQLGGGANGDTRDLAAALFSVQILPSRNQNDILLSRDTPRAYQVTVKEAIPEVILPGQTDVLFAFHAPEASEIALEAELTDWSKSSGGKASINVLLETEQGSRSLAMFPLTQQSGRQRLNVPLNSPSGIPAALRLVVTSDEPERAYIRVIAPRVKARSAAAIAPTSAPTAPAKPAHVLLVFFDAARAQSLGVYGHHRETSKTIDRIAKDGVVFENAYTTAVYTLAAMSSVWTSQQPDRHHGDVAFSAKLPQDRLTLAEILSAQGVKTAGFVANAVAGSYNGFDRGFTQFEDTWKRGSSAASIFRQALPSYLDSLKTEVGPTFTYVHYREPHHPYDPPPPFDTTFGGPDPITKERRSGIKADEWMKRVNQGASTPTSEEIEHLRRLYDGNMAFADSEFAWLRAEMEQRGLWEKTLVIVAGDHGEALYENGYIGHNTQVFEESARIPLIVSGPGVPKGVRVSGLTDLTDVAPTVLDVFGLAGTGGSAREFQGRSLLGSWDTPSWGKDAVLTRTVWDRPIYAMRTRHTGLIYETATTKTTLLTRKDGDRVMSDAEAAGVSPVQKEALRQELLSWIASLKKKVVGGSSAPMTRDQCEMLKALGYLDGTTKCPER